MQSVTQCREPAAPALERSSAGFLEVLDRAGHVVQRIRLQTLPVLVGRSYENDVILDDPYVSPVHLRVRLIAGRLIAEDMDSVNGLYRDRERRRIPHMELTSGAELRIGHTRLRYRDRDFTVPAALVDLSTRSPLLLLEKPLVLGLIYLLTLGWLMLANWLDSFEPLDAKRQVAGLVPVVLGVLLWSGIWAFASRLLTHRLNFLIHCGIACLGGLVLSLLTVCLSYLAFAFNMDALEESAQILVSTLLVGMLLYAHLRFCSPARPRRLAVTAGMLAALTSGLLLLETQVDRSDFNATPDFPTTLKPPAFQWTPSEPVTDFFGRAEDLQAQLSAMIESEQ